MPYLSKLQLQTELNKCLNCKTRPCMHACPVKCSPQEFIAQARAENYQGAVEIINRNNPLGHTCGLICPEHFCVKACLRSKIDNSLNIPLLQATLIKMFRNSNDSVADFTSNGKKVAVVGAGPAGLAATWQLLQFGYEVKIFEKSSSVGGALNLIPTSRLPHTAIEDDWNYIRQMGKADIIYNSKITNPLELLNEYSGVIMAIGEQNVVNLGIKGENNIIPYTEYLQYPHRFMNKQKVVVIGGGNVAADCAATAHNLGAKQIIMLVRRQINNLRIDKKELLNLIDIGINIMPNTRVVDVNKTDGAFQLETCSTYIDNGRCLDIPNSNVNRGEFDLIIKAIGSVADTPIEHERIIYAGDCKIGGSTVVEAIASGIDSARILHSRLVDEEKDIA